MSLGATWSYQPPQSSQVMTMAVFAQYGLLPIALTMEATQDGPPVALVFPGWSELSPVGITQFTCGRLWLLISVRTWVSLRTTLFTQIGAMHAVALGGVAFGPHIC